MRTILIVIFVLEILGGCGGVKEDSIASTSSKPQKRNIYIPKHRSFKQKVEKLLQLPLEERVQQYVARSEELSLGVGYRMGRGSLFEFLYEIVLHKDFEGISALESKLGQEQSNVLHRTLCYFKKGDFEKPVTKLLKKWALQYPSDPFLLICHPEGPRRLLAIIEDKTEEIERKYLAVRSILSLKYLEAIPVLEKYAFDKTIVSKVKALGYPLDPFPFGDYCIRVIYWLKGHDASVIIKYLKSGDPEAISVCLCSLAKDVKRNLKKNPENQEYIKEIKQYIKKLILSDNERIRDSAAGAAIFTFPELLRDETVNNGVLKLLDKLNKMNKDRAKEGEEYARYYLKEDKGTYRIELRRETKKGEPL